MTPTPPKPKPPTQEELDAAHEREIMDPFAEEDEQIKKYMADGIVYYKNGRYADARDQFEQIIAINTDPNAPIFKVAHVAITGDLYQIIPQLIEGIKARKATI